MCVLLRPLCTSRRLLARRRCTELVARCLAQSCDVGYYFAAGFLLTILLSKPPDIFNVYARESKIVLLEASRVDFCIRIRCIVLASRFDARNFIQFFINWTCRAGGWLTLMASITFLYFGDRFVIYRAGTTTRTRLVLSACTQSFHVMAPMRALLLWGAWWINSCICVRMPTPIWVLLA